MKDEMRERIRKLAIPIAVAVIGAVVIVASVQANLSRKSGDSAETPLPVLLEQNGFSGGVEEWLRTLNDEQVAMVDIAYESSVKSGYAESKERWVSDTVSGHLDGGGRMIVRLSDGGEFVMDSPHSDGSKTNGALSEGQAETQNGNEGDKKSSEAANEAAGVDGGASADADNPGGANDHAEGDQTALLNGTAGVVVDRVQSRRGDRRVAVPVRIERNPGLLGLTLSVSYDEPSLKLVGADNGSAFEGVLALTHSHDYASGCLFTWDAIELPKDGVRDGDILTLYFDVSDTASGCCTVAVRANGAAFDGNLDEVELGFEDGYVLVK